MSFSGLNMNPNLQSTMSTLAQFLACVIACFLMDLVGPRKLWITSTISCVISMLIYAYCIYKEDSIFRVPGFVPVLSVFVYCLSYG